MTTNPMPRDALAALRASIRKWEKIVAGTGVDKGAENCALCKKFLRTGALGCHGYSVAGKVKKDFCIRTPYVKWLSTFMFDAPVKEICADTPTRRRAARAELRFLKSLLPNEER